MKDKDEVTSLDGKKLVARLLTPVEVESVVGADFTNHGQSTSGGYCQFAQSSGGYNQSCVG
jgi:hypothetical protein